MYDALNSWYQNGVFTVDDLRDAVEAKWITSDEFEKISGEAYTAKTSDS